MNLKTYGIESLSTEKLKTAEFSQLTADTVSALITFAKEHKQEHLLTTHASRLETAQANYQSAPKGKAASAVVKDLDEVDQKRDNAYQTLVNFVKAYAHVDGQAVEAAYTKLRKANSLRFIKPASASKPIQDWPKQATKTNPASRLRLHH